MRGKKLWIVVLLSAATFLSTTRGLAHGEPELTVEPSTVAAGGEVTITGAEMEDGEVFALTLEGMFDTFDLGEVSVSGEGFSVQVTIPAEAAPGLYTLQAVSREGESVNVEITVLASSAEQDGDVAAAADRPSAEPLALERTRTTGDWLFVGALILLGGVGGFWLLKKGKQ